MQSRREQFDLIADLAADFRRKYPDVRLRLVGLNSSEVADQVRDATLEAGLIVLPVDDAGLDLRVARLEELVVVSRDPSRAGEPVTIEALAAVRSARARTRQPKAISGQGSPIRLAVRSAISRPPMAS